MSENEYIYCQKCGAKNRSGSSFCYNCGEKLEIPTEPITNSEEQYPENDEKGSDFLSILSIVLALVSVFLPFVIDGGFKWGLILAFIGLVCSILGVIDNKQHGSSPVIGIVGMVLNLCAICFIIITFVLIAQLYADVVMGIFEKLF